MKTPSLSFRTNCIPMSVFFSACCSVGGDCRFAHNLEARTAFMLKQQMLEVEERMKKMDEDNKEKERIMKEQAQINAEKEAKAVKVCMGMWSLSQGISRHFLSLALHPGPVTTYSELHPGSVTT